jgi:hypothetical protein
MNLSLRDAVAVGHPDAIEKILAGLKGREHWSLISVIDDLLPLSLMQSDLRYGNFHAVKMQLFLRRLAIGELLSFPTQRALAELVVREMARTAFIPVSVERMPRTASEPASPQKLMIEALKEGNVHNAFYYADAAVRMNAPSLIRTLLSLGACHIPETLGHSLSCFLPVMEDVVDAARPVASLALFSCVLYLARFRDIRGETAAGRAEKRVDYDALLLRCASGDGIVNLHHMITFSTLRAWEKAPCCANGGAPWKFLEKLIAGKKPDEERQRKAERCGFTGELSSSFDDFKRRFSFRELDRSLPLLFGLLEKKPRDAVDWIFRLYASLYRDGWDPHYFTSLYLALSLWREEKTGAVARRMALEQALRYFAKDMR